MSYFPSHTAFQKVVKSACDEQCISEMSNCPAPLSL